MGLTSSLNIGRTALSASQVAIQVTGNNFANASTPGYSRQRVNLQALSDQRWGNLFLGRGVGIASIQRQVDAALQNRLNGSISQQAAADVGSSFLTQLESIVNELGDNNLSDQFDEFYSAWSEIANSPNRDGARALVVQQGSTLAASIRATRQDLFDARAQLDQQMGAAVAQADNLLNQIATINTQIVNAEGGAGQSNSLRDQRDTLISQLSQIMDISTVEQANGAVDVLVGSTPVVLAGLNRGVTLNRSSDGESVTVNVRADGTQLSTSGGIIGGLAQQRSGTIDRTLNKLDDIAGQLIFQVNRIHSTGYGGTTFSSVRSTLTMPAADTTRPLNDPANRTFGDLPFRAVTGGFLVTVKNDQTGASQTVRVNVDLDGITAAGTSGTADDTSVSSLAADLGGIPNLSATVNPDGTLNIAAAAGYSVSFAEDSSGVLAVMGVNTYFTGSDATNIGIRQALVDEPRLLATGNVVGGKPTDNGAALAIAGLRTATNGTLNGSSISGAWRDVAQVIGAESQAAASRADASALVRDNLEAQRSAISGVSLDEESINLLNYQRMYQGAARFITVVDELTQTLLNMVG